MTYNKTTWKTGDLITADKLNNIENGISNKQDMLIAGTNITIENNVISSTGSTGSSWVKIPEEEVLIGTTGAVGTYEVDLSSKLPDISGEYELMIDFQIEAGSGGGGRYLSFSNMLDQQVGLATAGQYIRNSVVVPINNGKFKYVIIGSAATSVSIYFEGYRRIS